MSDTAGPPKRTIRSFVKRTGRMSPAQKKAYRDLFESYGLSPKESHFDLESIFKRIAPCVVEVGFGMGHTLIENALSHPSNDYIGIDVHEPGIGRVLSQIQKLNVENLRVANGDAKEVLGKSFKDDTVSEVHVWFPDPWPKKKHHKRRLIQEDFVFLIQQKLMKGGLLAIATDWEDYANHIQDLMKNISYFKSVDVKLVTRPSSNYEARGKRLGHSIWQGCYEKN